MDPARTDTERDPSASAGEPVAPAEGIRRPEGYAEADPPGNRPVVGDLLAGTTVALVVIPQSLAYATLAGMPAHTGLIAASIPLLFAVLFVSSPYLQTGPVALSSLLTLGALLPLAPAGSPEFVALAALLALMVGLFRVMLGVARLGVLAYLMSEPVLMGFTNASALLIIASQVPDALGVDPAGRGILRAMGWAIAHPDEWHLGAVSLAAGAVTLILAMRSLNPLLPGVLLASLAGIGVSHFAGYDGEVVGEIAVRFPVVSLALPWSSVMRLLPAGAIIGMVGFAEAASVSRRFAAMDRRPWSADREFVSQGVANIAAGLIGAFPVGGSLTRSSLNRMAGARTRWSGAVTGLLVLAFLPFSGSIAKLPTSVLSAIVIVAATTLLRPGLVPELWRVSRPQLLTFSTTFVLVLALAPRIEVAMMLGIGLSIGIHLWRELQIYVQTKVEGDTLHLRPHGVLWFGSAQVLEARFIEKLAKHPGTRKLVIHGESLGRVDLTGAQALIGLMRDAENAGIEVVFEGVHRRTGKVLKRVLRWYERNRDH